MYHAINVKTLTDKHRRRVLVWNRRCDRWQAALADRSSTLDERQRLHDKCRRAYDRIHRP